MKTKEENKMEVVKYLTTVSKHAYLNGDKPFRVVERGGEFLKVYGDKEYRIDIDATVQYYEGNSKNVIKNQIFGRDHDLKPIRMRYYLKLVNKKEVA
jgi:hypothetical protein